MLVGAGKKKFFLKRQWICIHMNEKIKKVFKKLDPELQEAVKFLINDIQVKREIKKLKTMEVIVKVTRQTWLDEKVTCDEWGRPPSLADVPIAVMTRGEAFVKQGGSKHDIDSMWKQKQQSLKENA
jgi:hypothetical protein